MKKFLIFLFFPFLIYANSNHSIIKATIENDIIVFKLLEKKYKKLDVKDTVMGKNLLGLAIYYGSNDVAKYLIKEHKYLINEVAKDTTTPLEDAVLKENEEILIDLLENGAVVMKREVYDLATKFGKGRMVKLLKDLEYDKREGK